MANVNVTLATTGQTVKGLELRGGDVKARVDGFGNVYLAFKNTLAMMAFEALFPEARWVKADDGGDFLYIPNMKVEVQEGGGGPRIFKFAPTLTDRVVLASVRR